MAVGAGRRAQLQMMLVQQAAGPAALPLSILSLDAALPFIRRAEDLILRENLAPVMVYWAKSTASKILPAGPRFRQMMRDCTCVSFFSEEQDDPPDEWCFLLESRGLSLVVYAQEAEETAKYQCSGSMDPQIVRQAFNRLLPVWQAVDLTESNRLEDARVNVGYSNSTPQLMQELHGVWPIVKSPIQQNLMLPGEGILMAEPSKISPIALAQDDLNEYGHLAGNPISETPVQSLSPNQNNGSPLAALSPTGPALNPFGLTGPGELPAATSGGFALQQIWGGDPPPLPAPARPSGEPLPTPNGTGGGNGSQSGFIRTGGIAAALGELRNLRETMGTNEADNRSDEGTSGLATAIISDIIGQLRHSSDLNSILQFAIETLTQAARADRGLIWQVVGSQLGVTNEYAANVQPCFAGNQLGAQESTAIVLEFLSLFPDESGAGVISVPNTAQDTHLHKVSPTLSSLIELGEVKARLMVQLRSRGIFSGFLEIQQCKSARQWSRQDAIMLQGVAEMLSVVVQQSFDQSKIEMDAREMKLINEIASLFRESRGQTSQESIVKSVMLVAEHMGFVHSQIYLYHPDEELLVPQIPSGNSAPVSLSKKDNPFVAVFESGRGKEINMEYSRKSDSFFGHDMALILPLVSEAERLGVVGLWQRHSNKSPYRAEDRELGLTIAGHLSSVIRAEQAILQIRAEQARAALINTVSSEIRQSLKEVDQIMGTLVESLRSHFDLAQCVVSLFDSQTHDFSKSKSAMSAEVAQSEQANNKEDQAHKDLTPNLGEHLFLATLDELEAGHTIFLGAEQARQKLASRNIDLPSYFKSAILVPLVHAGKFKASLCMVSSQTDHPLPKNDMNMVADLADRVAVVVSHAELFAQVERQAVTDPMTGLFNRRYFQEQLSKEIDRFQRFGHPFSYLIVDLDFLKKINDNLGHQFGDLAIKHIANVLKRNVRDVDTVGRYGGEEFVVLLPETDPDHARIVAERICTAIREKPIDDVGTITASLGLATFPYDAEDGKQLFELADQALFLAKRLGRNQVCSVSTELKATLAETGEQLSGYKEKSAQSKLEETAKSIDLNSLAEMGLVNMLTNIARAIEERDLYDADRSPRAHKYALKMAQTLQLTKEHSEVIALAAMLNNLGKIDIPAKVLQKPGPLTDEETELIKQAPSTAARLLEPARLLMRVAPILEAYQERWDGSGYPKGLKGDDIPMEARIVSLIDAFVAMTSNRPYRKGLSKEEAIQQIQQGAGKHWDPRIVRIFLAMLNKE
jgi:diguanylate cyclase (GGDEF)-like protein